MWRNDIAHLWRPFGNVPLGNNVNPASALIGQGDPGANIAAAMGPSPRPDTGGTLGLIAKIASLFTLSQGGGALGGGSALG